MDYGVMPKAQRYTTRRRQWKRWQKVVSVLGCIVVFCTTYALIIPAITQERETFCGMEEHIHGKDCKAQTVLTELVCTAAEGEGHIHGDDCYELRSGHVHSDGCYELTAGHTHDDNCYTLTGGHSHSDGCYVQEGGHTHGDGCYEWSSSCPGAVEGHEHTDECQEQVQTLVCSQSESAPQTVLTCSLDESPAQQVLVCELEETAETQVLVCTLEEAESQQILTCTLEESEPHTHGEACYKTTQQEGDSTCSKVEHEHSDPCYSDPSADIETAAAWERSFAGLKLTGLWAEDVLELAETQLGYQESIRNYVMSGDETKGYTRYGAWYGIPYGDWCAMFVSFCLNYAEVEGMPLDCNCQNWINTLSGEKLDLYRTKDVYDPRPGDLIFFDWTGDGRANHVGLVKSLEETENGIVLTTLEGNSSNRVKINTYNIGDDSILGYGMLPVNQVVRTADIYTDDTYSDLSDDTTVITLTGPIPKNAEVRAFPVTVETAMEVLCAYDIAIFRADGSVYEPDASVSVNIASPALEEMDQSELEMEVYYIPDEGSPEPMDTNVSEDGVTFDAPHFSTYAVMAVQPRASYTEVNSESALSYALSQGNSVRLTGDFDVAGELTVGGSTVYLDLNGHHITCTSSASNSTGNPMIKVPGGVTLVIQDSQATTETVTETALDPLGAHAATTSLNNGTVSLTYYVTTSEITNAATGATRETVYEHKVSTKGWIKGAKVPIFMVDGTLTLESGMLYGGNNRAILANNTSSPATINLTGGYICGFYRSDGETKTAAAIYMNPGTLNISGTAVVADNQADMFGGAINIRSAEINMTGGFLAGNRIYSPVRGSVGSGSDYNADNLAGGGALRVEKCEFNFSGGYITNNEVILKNGYGYWSGGGGIWLEDGATLNMSGGYLTSNEAPAGGAIKTEDLDSGDTINMTGGFICSNLASYAEGGGIGIGINDTGVISGGYINNNETNCRDDWGGGGVFVANGGYLYLRNVLITENDADGFGGGVAGCSTARMHISVNEGAAIYDNEAQGIHTSGQNSTKNEDWRLALNNPVFMANGYADLFSALNCTVEGAMLGGGIAYWQGTCDGQVVRSTSESDVIRSETMLGLTSHPTSQGIANAQANAKVYFNGNYSYTHGGAILCNGYMEIGTPKEVVIGARIEVAAKKSVENLTMADGEFTFVITDEYGTVIATGTNDTKGAITFDGRIPLNEADTHIYYIYEVPGNNASINYDTTRYRMTVVTSRSKITQAGANGTVYQCKVDSLKVDKWNTQWNRWDTYISEYNPEDSANSAIQVDLGANGATFTNKLRENTNIKVEKVWDCDANDVPESITVNLIRKKIETGETSIVETVTLKASTNPAWTASWTGLSTQERVWHNTYYGGYWEVTTYTYEVQEIVPEGFDASYSYTSTGNGFEVTITNSIQTFGIDVTKTNEANEVLEGAVFHVLNSNGETLKFIKDVSGAYVMDKSRLALPELTTDAKGKILITGLPAGTYTLREVKAPPGYGVADDIEITLGPNAEGMDANGLYPVTVVNREPSYTLPETGGPGTSLYTMGGVLLMAAAGLTLLYNHTRRRKEETASS